MSRTRELKLQEALDAAHYYIDATDRELQEDNLTRACALLKAREMRDALPLDNQDQLQEPPMRFSTAYNWMRHGKKMRCPGFIGYWRWNDDKETIEIVTKKGEVLDIRESTDIDFTMGFINSDEWEFYEGPENPADA